jgi:hypothetical protein
MPPYIPAADPTEGIVPADGIPKPLLSATLWGAVAHPANAIIATMVVIIVNIFIAWFPRFVIEKTGKNYKNTKDDEPEH